MESLSRPFHSRKLSNAAQNHYDVVFSGDRRKYPQPDVIDYHEIFGSSQPSSIPVLDLSTLEKPAGSFRDLKPDYSNIFGGFSDESVAVSYQELFGYDKLRAPTSTVPASQDLENLSRQSPDALKKFSMSYNKISPKSRDGLDGTKHVTQVPAVTGFTCFVDEPVMEAKKPNLSAVNVKPSRNFVRKESNPVESKFEDKQSKIFDNDFKIHPFKVSSSPTGVVNHKDDDAKRAVNSESRKTDFDVNSAASALKQAIEKAQESIRIAKESVGRKKNGLRSFSDKKIKNNFKVEEQKRSDEDSSQVIQDVGRNRKYGGSTVVPNFMESEKLYVAKKFIDEIHEKLSESVKDSKFGSDPFVCNATQVTSETEAKPLGSALKDEYATLCYEAVDTETSKNQISECVHEYQTDNKIVDKHEAENETVGASLELENEKQENVVEHEEVEYAESEKHVEIDEASESVESENESKHDQNIEIRNDEENSEVFDSFCEMDAKDSMQTCDNTLEESEVNLHDDFETKQEDDHLLEIKKESLDETCDKKIDEKPSGDDEVHVASNNAEMNDANVEITQDVDDVAEVSCEFQAEEADLCDKTSIDRTSSDDNNDDEYEVKSEKSNITDNVADLCSENDVQSESSSGCTHGEKKIEEESNITDNLADLGSENDVRSDSSSGSTHGEKIIDEESNIQPPQKVTPDAESTNEIKDSQEPESRHKDEERGPSNVSRKDLLNKIDEEAAAKQREWEKNRLAVDRVIREARERAFAEARERAERERAAVEKATEEVRQRMMAEAHEKVSSKAASVTNKSSSDKTSAQSKLRAERAAVERATAEARQRALEKAISQKTASDLNRSESALRTKAKLEKHNRIMERAAKALAEKEKRDRLAQKEQAERNRLAENLDADIKRWSNGKEGNLRALLSTLQYILGPESGWKPVTLTEIITTSAVKKAYRKATLCVHPDKLQQRGATVQQKYICEKVFDLLKAAWNKFNSEER